MEGISPLAKTQIMFLLTPVQVEAASFKDLGDAVNT